MESNNEGKHCKKASLKERANEMIMKYYPKHDKSPHTQEV